MKLASCSKTYGRRTVLRCPALDFAPGRICALAGPNGSGKSTYARLAAGVLTPDGGGRVADETGVIRYMPQKSFPFRMSTEKNILQNGNDPARARKLMQTLGIDALAGQSAKRLSGGETARMALCRILMKRYDLLILDEPTTAMDMESTLAAEKLIRETCGTQDCALVLITHSISQARRISDRVLVLRRGVLIEQGESGQVLTEPKEEETRRFLDFYAL